MSDEPKPTKGGLNSRKKGCPEGHPYDRRSPTGQRYCSICKLAQCRANRARKKAVA